MNTRLVWKRRNCFQGYSIAAILTLIPMPALGQMAAQFPNERISVANFTQTNSIDLQAIANDGVGPNDNNNPPMFSESDEDFKQTIASANAADGSVTGTSAADVTTEFLPYVGASLLTVEATSSVGGGWGASAFGAGQGVQVVNWQQSTAVGRTEVLSSPSNPTLTQGTMQIVLKLDSASVPFAVATMGASVREAGMTTGGSFVNATNFGMGWFISGQLEQVGGSPVPVMDFVMGRGLARTYTASKIVSVGSQWDTRSSINAPFPPGGQPAPLASGASVTQSFSAVASYWVE